MKVKTSELFGKALDWAVAKCEQATCKNIGAPARYSTDWSQGGPIIERELIRIIAPTVRGVEWVARIKQGLPSSMNGWFEKTGSTPLIAAMRCYVTFKMGDEVEIPEELIK